MAKEDRVPASQDKADVGGEDRSVKRAPSASEQQAELNNQAFYIECSRRTGLSLSKSESLVERLRDKGDFFDEKGRWTLDVAGYPVCHEGWKPEPIEPPTP